MNTTEVKGNWNEQKGKLKQKFAVLTDNDLMFDEGKKDEMLGKLQIKLGKTKEELQRIIGSIWKPWQLIPWFGYTIRFFLHREAAKNGLSTILVEITLCGDHSPPKENPIQEDNSL